MNGRDLYIGDIMKYFGTDGIRGKANITLTVDTAFKLGKALSLFNCKEVVVGTDTRLSKDMYLDALCSGAMSMGINVIKVGVVSTPCLIYYSGIKHIIGVIITASHNPYYDNGLKVVYDGKKLNSSQEKELEKYIESDINIYPNEIGKEINNCDILQEYQNLLNKILTPINKRICVDCANGATSFIAKRVFDKVTDKLKTIANNPNGTNINDKVGSTHLESLIRIMKEENYDIGFAFDGDGDRVIAIDEYGNIVDGDKLICIIAIYLKEKNQLNDNKVVYTKMTNLGVISHLKENSIECILTDVGDKYVAEALKKYNLSIGGENSGHIIIPSLLNTGDGLLTALFVLKIMKEYNKSLYELSSSIFMYPEKMVNIEVKDKTIINKDIIQNKVKEIASILKEEGKIILRASGTENLIRLSVSAKEESLVDKYINELITLIKEVS